MITSTFFKATLLFCFTLFSLNHSSAQNDCYFKFYNQIYHTGIRPFFTASQATDGYLVYESNQSANYSFRYYKVDFSGQTAETKNVLSGLSLQNASIIHFDGKRFFTGKGLDGSVKLTNLEENGAVNWDKNYQINPDYNYSVKAIFQTEQQEIYVFAKGLSKIIQTDSIVGCVLKTDKNGGLIWKTNFVYPTYPNIDIYDGVIRFDGGLTIRFRYEDFPYRDFLAQIEPDGKYTFFDNEIQSWFGDLSNLNPHGGLVLPTYQLPPQSIRFYNTSGKLIYQMNYDTCAHCTEYPVVSTDKSGNYLVLTKDSIFKLNQNFQLEWIRSIPFLMTYYDAKLFVLADNSILMSGSYGPTGPGGGLRLWTAHCDSLDRFDCTTVETNDLGVNTLDFKVFPNPAHQFITVESDNESISRVEILDILGRRIRVQNTLNLNYSIQISIEGFLPGPYFLKVISQNKAGIKPFSIILK